MGKRRKQLVYIPNQNHSYFDMQLDDTTQRNKKENLDKKIRSELYLKGHSKK